MRHRVLLLLLVTLAACGGRSPQTAGAPATVPAVVTQAAVPAEPATLRYTPASGRYRVDAVVQTSGPQSANVNTTLLLSTRISELGGQLELAAVVDSFGVSGDMPQLEPGMIAGVKGRTLRTRFTPSGRRLPWIDSANANDELASQLLRNLREMMSTLPPGTIAPGGTWTDTVSESTSLPGGAGTLETRSVRQHRVVGWETRDSVRALHISTSAAHTISGAGEIQGTALAMDGTGTSTLERWVSTAGVLIGATGNEDNNITVVIASAGMSIPVRQQSRTTVSRLQ